MSTARAWRQRTTKLWRERQSSRARSVRCLCTGRTVCWLAAAHSRRTRAPRAAATLPLQGEALTTPNSSLSAAAAEWSRVARTLDSRRCARRAAGHCDAAAVPYRRRGVTYRRPVAESVEGLHHAVTGCRSYSAWRRDAAAATSGSSRSRSSGRTRSPGHRRATWPRCRRPQTWPSPVLEPAFRLVQRRHSARCGSCVDHTWDWSTVSCRPRRDVLAPTAVSDVYTQQLTPPA